MSTPSTAEQCGPGLTAEQCGPGTPIAVAFSWHQLAFEELRELVRHAEACGYAAVYVDGDVSQIPSLGEREVLDGFTVTTALLAATERIAVTSIRLVHHWNAARLAQASARLERIFPGRTRLFVSIGGQRSDRRFGLPLDLTGLASDAARRALDALAPAQRAPAAEQP